MIVLWFAAHLIALPEQLEGVRAYQLSWFPLNLIICSFDRLFCHQSDVVIYFLPLEPFDRRRVGNFLSRHNPAPSLPFLRPFRQEFLDLICIDVVKLVKELLIRCSIRIFLHDIHGFVYFDHILDASLEACSAQIRAYLALNGHYLAQMRLFIHHSHFFKSIIV